MVALTAILVCMIISAFMSGMETGVISIHRVRLRHRVEAGSRNARILQGFLHHSDRFLGTILVGTNICAVVCATFAARIATAVFPLWGKVLSSLVMTLLLLVLCEYLPKAWFQSRPLERTAPFARLLTFFQAVLHPLAVAATWITGWFVPRAQAGAAGIKKPFVSREDLKVLSGEMTQHGTFSPWERTMIHRVFDLSSRTAGQIMTPAERIKFVCGEIAADEALATARETGFTRMPVYEERKKKFTGVVNVFDILSDEDAASGNVADHARAPQFIPDYMAVDDILPRMRRTRQSLFLVTDVHSQVVGLVTIEDVLEEIVGNL